MSRIKGKLLQFSYKLACMTLGYLKKKKNSLTYKRLRLITYNRCVCRNYCVGGASE